MLTKIKTQKAALAAQTFCCCVRNTVHSTILKLKMWLTAVENNPVTNSRNTQQSRMQQGLESIHTHTHTPDVTENWNNLLIT